MIYSPLMETQDYRILEQGFELGCLTQENLKQRLSELGQQIAKYKPSEVEKLVGASDQLLYLEMEKATIETFLKHNKEQSPLETKTQQPRILQLSPTQ